MYIIHPMIDIDNLKIRKKFIFWTFLVLGILVMSVMAISNWFKVAHCQNWASGQGVVREGCESLI